MLSAKLHVVKLCLLIALVLAFFTGDLSVADSPDAASGRTLPVVGAIRWDAWFEGSDYEKNLTPRRWHDRLPFYARISPDGSVSVRSDSEKVMDQEITYAKDAGIGFWAFCYYHYQSGTLGDRYNYGLRRYLASKKRAGLDFCLILQASHIGLRKDWPQTVKQLVTYFKDPAYKKVLNGRPLLYIFDGHNLANWAGSDEAATAALEELDQAAARAGLPELYVVASVTEKRGAKLLKQYGLDAMSSYSLPPKGEDIELPYSELTKSHRKFWDASKAMAKQFIPMVSTGWDNRPRRTTPELTIKLRGPWYTPPTPGELAIHLYTAIEWVRNNPESAEANVVIIYAWNESDEGGWLVPTLAEGNARLQAVKAALQMR